MYAQTTGPRFETAAEIRVLAQQGGDIVGMTCGFEAALFRELSIPYALLCIVDNMANGISGTEISYEEFHAGVKKNLSTMETIFTKIMDAFSPKHTNGAANGALAAASSSVSAVPAAAAAKLQVDSMVHARWIVPILPAVVLEHHSLVVSAGKIVAVLPTAEAKLKYSATHEEDLPTSTLMPGFVNAHSHLGMSLMRGYADDFCLSDWLTKHIWPGEAKFVSPEFVRDSSELGVAEMIRGGTTCCNDMYWFPEVLTDIVHQAGIRALIGLIVIDFPTNYASSAEDCFAKGMALYSAKKNLSDRISFSLAPHAPYTVCDANLAKCHQLATEAVLRNPGLGTSGPLSASAKLHIHLHETAAEVADSATLTPSMACHRSTHKCRPVHNLDAYLHMLDKDLIAVHMTQLLPAEIERLAATRSSVVHCATSNLKLASGMCLVAQLDKAGVNVALGTDSTASNNGLDMFSEMKLAAVLAKGVAADPTVLPCYNVLKMATYNGAVALGLDQQTGSLEVGKSADFISVRMDSLEALPLFSVLSHLVYVSSREHVENVWVSGKRLMRNRALLTLDEESIKARAVKWQSIMAAEKMAQAAAAAAVVAAAVVAAAAEANGAGKKRSAADDAAVSSSNKPKKAE